ncbi:glycosyltransferase family 4 protein [Kineococcus arenarius]|uniref:glycosyltransferase family 4 protein n=1 Tax=Kineococcus sp. SYSU DK007 TaxID=3383128 RepID=UPI003D7D8FF6
MRILHLLNDVVDLGNGINNSTVDLACAQRELGHDVHVASAGGAQVAVLEAEGVVHHTIDQERAPASIARASAALLRLVRRLGPDVVHVHNLTGAVLAGARWPRPYALVATLHLEEKRGVAAMALADRVIAFHDSARLASLVPGRQRRLDVIRQGILGGARSRMAVDELPEVSHPAIVTVCGMYEHKGIFDLLDAFGEVLPDSPEAHIYFVGNGPDRERLERSSAAKPYADRVHVVGFQPRPAPWLRAADVFVLASRREVAALVLAEARNEGLAPVATTAGGIPTLVEDGVSGLLSPPGDVPALAANIRRMLLDQPLREELERRAVEGLEDLSIRRFACDVIALYREVLAGKR